MSENSTSNFVAPSEQPGHEIEKTEQKPYELIVKELDERFKASMKRWEDWGRKTLNSGESPSHDDEPRIVRLEKEIEELKKDKSAKDKIIAEFAKDRIDKDTAIRDLQQRISRLEAAQNFANRM